MRSKPGRLRTGTATPAPLTPFEHAQGLDWCDRRPTRAFFRSLGRVLERSPNGMVALVAGPQATAWATLFARAWPDVQLVVVTVDDDQSEAHARLSAYGRFDVVVQAVDTSALVQARLFKRTFPHLREGGVYLTPQMLPWTADDTAAAEQEMHAGGSSERALPNEDGRSQAPHLADLWTMVAEAQSARLSDFEDRLDVGERFEDVRGLGRRLGQVHVISKALRLRAEGEDQAKLTEAEADIVLAKRSDIGRTVTSLPATTVAARGSYLHNLGEDRYFVPQMAVPKHTLREYFQPVCSRGQIVTNGNLLLPDTYRHHLAPRLVNVYVEEAGPRFGNVRRDISAPDRLPGPWFHLDSEWPGHFGHTLTELLGRMWAWDQVRRAHPEVKGLLTAQHDRVPVQLQQFEIDIFAAFGISPQDVHIFERPCQPDSLYAATSMFSLPDYVHPEIVTTWDRVGDFLAAQADERPRPRRIFCTRPGGGKRHCRNTTEVEQLFKGRGFEVIRPEEHPIAEQVAMFRSAEAVAGFAGSGLFTLALCSTPKKVFAIAPTSYTARNEHLIAGIRGHELVSAWSTPDLDHPEGLWTQQAFGSDYTFDMSDEGVFLDEHLSKLDG